MHHTSIKHLPADIVQNAELQPRIDEVVVAVDEIKVELARHVEALKKLNKERVESAERAQVHWRPATS